MTTLPPDPEADRLLAEFRKAQDRKATANTRQCYSCSNPFEYQPRTQIECEVLRRALLVTAPQFDPVICDGCFNRGMTGYGAADRAMQVPNHLLR